MTVSPVSSLVLGSAALLSAPALKGALLDATLPIDVALTRYLIAVVMCWVALSVFLSFVSPGRRPEPVAQETLTEERESVS